MTRLPDAAEGGSAMAPEEYIQRLIEISRNKLECFERLLKLTESQAGAIEAEDVGILEGLVAEKQVEINEINRLDEEFEVYFRRLKSVLGEESLDRVTNADIKSAKELKKIVAAIMDSAGKIEELERQNGEKARRLLDKFGEEIKKINRGMKVASAYMPEPAKPPSYFIDKKK